MIINKVKDFLPIKRTARDLYLNFNLIYVYGNELRLKKIREMVLVFCCFLYDTLMTYILTMNYKINDNNDENDDKSCYL